MAKRSFASRSSLASRRILSWYRRHGRTLPWRNIRDPYKVILSEIMLQQTQVSRVLVKFPEFLSRFPTFRSLARANRSSVVQVWRGMGYNNRAVRLRELARSVVRDHGGTMPKDIETLRSLPGVGKYTAHAFASFAAKAHVPVVDTNVRRVLARLFPSEAKRLDEWDLAEKVLPSGKAYEWNQALMDFGAMVCTAASPKCGECPLGTTCPSAHPERTTPAAATKREPGRRGIPNRIYRGKVVDYLRRNRTATAGKIAEQTVPQFREKDGRWFNRIIAALERDGLIAIKRGRGGLRISLAD